MVGRRLEIGAHEAEPLHFPVARVLRLVFVAVADENGRLGQSHGKNVLPQCFGRAPAHGRKSSEMQPAHPTKSLTLPVSLPGSPGQSRINKECYDTTEVIPSNQKEP